MADERGHVMFASGEGYEKSTGGWCRLLAPGFVDFMEIQEGDSVLDVGCGTGILTFAIAEATKASVIVGLDLSKGFIEYARARNTDSRVRFEQGNAQNLPFPDAAFDRCMSLLAINFIPDPSKALSEMKRVTKAGGRIGAVSWDSGNIFNRALCKAAITVDPQAEQKARRPPQRYNSADGLATFWTDAGLHNVTVTGLSITREFDSLDDYWLPFFKDEGVGGAYLATLSPERRAAVRERLRHNLLGDRPDGSFSLSARAWAVRGEVPEFQL